jgi:hypothetical protein
MYRLVSGQTFEIEMVSNKSGSTENFYKMAVELLSETYGKEYNQTTTKICDSCDLCDIYKLLNTEISDTYEKSEFLSSFSRP